MVIFVGDEVELLRPEDCKRFHVEALDTSLLTDALGAAGAGRFDGEHAWIDIDWVRRVAGSRVADGWDAEFDGMVEFARTKGWLSDDGASIRAHVESAESA